MGKPGRVTMRDVAEKAGVSIKTVSRVVNRSAEVSEETRKRVQKVIQDLGYHPNIMARSLHTRRTHTVGLVVPDITDPFWPEVVHGVQVQARESGYSVILVSSGEDPGEELFHIELFLQKQVDGIILCSSRGSADHLRHIVDMVEYIVLVNRSISRAPGVGSVRVNNMRGAYLATKYLLEQGRQRVACVSGPSHWESSKERYRGYKMALQEKGLPIDQRLTAWLPPKVFQTAERMEEAARLAASLLETDSRIDAIFVHDDVSAFGILKLCKQKSLDIPGDIAIVSFDDILLASMVDPPLTTVAIPKQELGAQAMRLLKDLLEGKEPPSTEVIIEPHLIIRESS